MKKSEIDIRQKTYIPESDAGPHLETIDGKLSLTDGKISACGDFAKFKKRLTHANLSHEMLVKAVKVKNAEMPLTVLDATAGLGEDSLLLAAAGYKVDMCEKNATVYALLTDTLKRALDDPELKPIASRMSALNTDSLAYMRSQDNSVDIVYLDPMFPERTKSAQVKKKFQLIHGLEKPCENEQELLNEALIFASKRVVVKRPKNGNFLAERKPDYSINGSSVRYDCYVTGNKN